MTESFKNYLETAANKFVKVLSTLLEDSPLTNQLNNSLNQLFREVNKIEDYWKRNLKSLEKNTKILKIYTQYLDSVLMDPQSSQLYSKKLSEILQKAKLHFLKIKNMNINLEIEKIDAPICIFKRNSALNFEIINLNESFSRLLKYQKRVLFRKNLQFITFDFIIKEIEKLFIRKYKVNQVKQGDCLLMIDNRGYLISFPYKMILKEDTDGTKYVLVKLIQQGVQTQAALIVSNKEGKILRHNTTSITYFFPMHSTAQEAGLETLDDIEKITKLMYGGDSAETIKKEVIATYFKTKDKKSKAQDVVAYFTKFQRLNLTNHRSDIQSNLSSRKGEGSINILKSIIRKNQFFFSIDLNVGYKGVLLDRNQTHTRKSHFGKTENKFEALITGFDKSSYNQINKRLNYNLDFEIMSKINTTDYSIGIRTKRLENERLLDIYNMDSAEISEEDEEKVATNQGNLFKKLANLGGGLPTIKKTSIKHKIMEKEFRENNIRNRKASMSIKLIILFSCCLFTVLLSLTVYFIVSKLIDLNELILLTEMKVVVGKRAAERIFNGELIRDMALVNEGYDIISPFNMTKEEFFKYSKIELQNSIRQWEAFSVEVQDFTVRSLYSSEIKATAAKGTARFKSADNYNIYTVKEAIKQVISTSISILEKPDDDITLADADVEFNLYNMVNDLNLSVKILYVFISGLINEIIAANLNDNFIFYIYIGIAIVLIITSYLLIAYLNRTTRNILETFIRFTNEDLSELKSKAETFMFNIDAIYGSREEEIEMVNDNPKENRTLDKKENSNDFLVLTKKN